MEKMCIRHRSLKTWIIFLFLVTLLASLSAAPAMADEDDNAGVFNKALSSSCNVIAETLKSGDYVRLHGFDPHTKKTIDIPSKNYVRFLTSKNFINFLNN